MDKFITFLSFFIFCVSGFSQGTKPVSKYTNNNALTENLKVPSGISLDIDGGNFLGFEDVIFSQTPKISLDGSEEFFLNDGGLAFKTTISNFLNFINSDITSLSGITGSISSPTYIQMGGGSATTLSAGRIWYNETNGTWNAGMGNGNITQQIGEELFRYGKASSAITDSPLQLVYKTGVVGASGVLTFAPAVAGITDSDQIIGCATENIASNDFGRVTTYGIVNGITTNGTAYSETWADNDDIYYNPSTGGLTKTIPSAPGLKVQIGTVIKAGSGGSGSFIVKLGVGTRLSRASDVQITTPATGNLLSYDTTLGYWNNVSAFNQFRLVDNFIGNIQPQARSSGTNATVSTGTGLIVNRTAAWLQTGTTATGYSQLIERNSGSPVAWVSGSSSLDFSWAMLVGNLSDGTETYTVRAGLENNNFGSVNDGVFFRYTHSVNSGNWICVTRRSGVETVTNTSTAPTTASYTKFQILINSAGTSVSFLINGSVVATHTTNIPTSAGYSIGIIKSLGTTTRYLYISPFQYIQTLNTPY